MRHHQRETLETQARLTNAPTNRSSMSANLRSIFRVVADASLHHCRLFFVCFAAICRLQNELTSGQRNVGYETAQPRVRRRGIECTTRGPSVISRCCQIAKGEGLRTNEPA